MILVDQLIHQIKIMFNPQTNIENNTSVVKTLTYYYKLQVIPFCIYLILDLKLNASSSSLTTPVFGLSGNLLIIFTDLVVFWFILPIIILIGAGLYHFFGKSVFKQYKGNFKDTLTASTYSVATVAVLGWLTLIPVASPYLSYLIGVWSFFVLVLSQCVLQKISGLASALTIFGTGVVLAILGVVAGYLLGIL